MRISFLAATVLLAAITCIAAQDFDLAGFRRCARISLQQVCGDSTQSRNVLQSALDMAEKCNNLSEALFVANQCARDSESGIYCGEVYAYARDIGALSADTCLSTIIGGNCTSDCRNGLTAIRENLGCCINALVNITGSFYAFASSAFTYDLWSRCGVDPPSSTCSGALDINLPGSRQSSCNVEQPLGCSQLIRDAIVDSISGDPDCGAILQYQMEACSQRENGDYCVETLEGDLNNFTVPILTACGASLFVQTCSNDCKILLERFVDERGCCVNAVFNSTFAAVNGLDFASLVLANNLLFDLCQVEPPSLTCGSLPFRVPSFTLLIPLIIATMFGRRMM